MARNDTYVKSNSSLGTSSSMIVDGSGAGTGEVDITEIGGQNAVEVYRDTDTAGDGSWANSTLLKTTADHWHTQLNNFRCTTSGSGDPQRLRLFRPSSSSSGPVYAVGVEI